MWSLVLSMLLAAVPDNLAPIPDSPVWTIAADGLMVEMYAATVVQLPADEPEEEIQEHTGQVITEPKVVNHKNHYGCQCAMCRGLHLANAHGINNAKWNRLKLWQGNKMDSHHAKLHREGVYEKPKGGCPGGVCPAPQRVGLFQRVRSWGRGRR